MADAVYLETTFISYLVARDTEDVVRQGQQQVTRQWWSERRLQFEMFTSQFVIDESSAGDPFAAAERLAVLADNWALGDHSRCISSRAAFALCRGASRQSTR